MKRTMTLGLLAVAAVAAVAVTANAQEKAPQPAKAIDRARFYTGRWYEIGRTPMGITNGCVAGTTDWRAEADGGLFQKDACRQGSPEGKEKLFAGPVTILDPDRNTKIKVHYKLFGLFTAPKTWWILDHGDDYDWFIMSDPSFKILSIFTRAANPPQAQVVDLTARAKALGYDTSKLEFPARFPAGQGAPAS